MLEGEPFSAPEVKRRALEILTSGEVTFSQHALDELENDKMTTVDATNVIRGGLLEFAEEVRGSHRYRLRTMKMLVVVSFRSETELRVVTAWRLK